MTPGLCELVGWGEGWLQATNPGQMLGCGQSRPSGPGFCSLASYSVWSPVEKGG